MRKSNEQSLKDVITDWMKGTPVKGKMAEVTIVNDWETIVGQLIAKHTTHISVSHEKLYVKLNSAPLRNELNFSRSKIVELVNEHAGMKLIQDVVILPSEK